MIQSYINKLVSKSSLASWIQAHTSEHIHWDRKTPSGYMVAFFFFFYLTDENSVL